MRSAWIATCSLAVIGAFYVVLQLLWLVHIDPEWLPYVAHVIGAVLAGAAMARATPMRSLREPFIAGALAVTVLATVTYVAPSVFVLTAARSDHRWLVLPAVVAASSIACVIGARLGAGADAGPRRAWIAVVAAATAACAMQLGGRLGFALGVPFSLATVTIETGTLAFLAAVATQAMVAVEASGAIAAGVTAYLVLEAVAYLERHRQFDWSAPLLLAPIVAAALGARVAWYARVRIAARAIRS